MYKAIYFLLLGLLLFPAKGLYSQKLYTKNLSMLGLQKGDTMPGIPITIHTGDKISYANTHDYKGKVLLLDFWGVGCLGCITGLPKMKELQEKLKDKLQVLVVTKNTDKEIQKLWKTFENKTRSSEWVEAGRQLPFVKQDTVLYNLFPREGLPIHAWIDTNGVVIGVSYPGVDTEENILKMYTGEPVSLLDKNDIYINIDDPMTWLDQFFELGARPSYYSFIVKRIDFGTLSGMLIPIEDSLSGHITGYSCHNYRISRLYSLAYKSWKDSAKVGFEIPKNRIIVENYDSTKIFPPDKESSNTWLYNNQYSYAIKLPVDNAPDLEHYIRDDLDRYFNIRSSIQKRRVKCLILRRCEATKKIPHKEKEGYPKEYKNGEDNLIRYRGAPKRYLFYEAKHVFAFHGYNLPFLDETGPPETVYVDIPYDEDRYKRTIKGLVDALKPQGFEIIEDYREIEMLVLQGK